MGVRLVMMADGKSGEGVNWPCRKTFTKGFEFFNEFYFYWYRFALNRLVSVEFLYVPWAWRLSNKLREVNSFSV